MRCRCRWRHTGTRYERHRRAAIAGRLLRITGRLQREAETAHLIAWKIEDLSPLLDRLGLPAGRERPDELRRGPPAPASARHPREEATRLFPSRNFH